MISEANDPGLKDSLGDFVKDVYIYYNFVFLEIERVNTEVLVIFTLRGQHGYAAYT